MKILGRVTSINVRKVLWVAGELGLAYDRDDWGLPLRDPNVPEFLALNPNAQVPVIVDDGFVLYESNAILRYLAAKHRALLADSLEGQAIVDQWLSWQVVELNPQWGYAVQALMRKNPAYTDASRIADSIAKWTTKMRILEGQLQLSRYVAGADFSVADIAIALSSHRWFSTPLPDRETLRAVEEHYRRMQARPAGTRWMTADTP